MHLKYSQVSSYCLSAAGHKKEDKFLLDLNIRLIIIVSVIVILFQAVNLFETHTIFYPYLRLGSFILTVASVLNLIILFIIYRYRIDKSRIIIITYHFYIIILNICLTPFICRDADTTQIPINIVLFYFLLTLGPLFSQRENIIIVSTTSFYNIIVVMLCGAKPLFAFIIAAGALTVIIKSDLLNNNYIKTIYRLQIERDTDELTGILNRRSGIESAVTALQECIRYNKTCSVLIVDIDFFKNYNDCYGHIHGDEVLRIIAKCITEQFNKKGNIVYRMGGEEFVVFAEADGSAEIIAEAKELQKRITEIETDFTRAIPLPTVSIGIVLYRPGTGYTGEPFDLISLVSGADCQLYNAKKSGRNIISHDNIIYR